MKVAREIDIGRKFSDAIVKKPDAEKKDPVTALSEQLAAAQESHVNELAMFQRAFIHAISELHGKAVDVTLKEIEREPVSEFDVDVSYDSKGRISKMRFTKSYQG